MRNDQLSPFPGYSQNDYEDEVGFFSGNQNKHLSLLLSIACRVYAPPSSSQNMPTELEPRLERWIEAHLIDTSTADKIRIFEKQRGVARGTSKWQVILALALGALMLTAGVLLFVAAHWDQLSPYQRFSLVLLMVAVFHVGGAIASERFHALGIALHAAGTGALGAGIFLNAQIFNLQEHWPGGIMLWAFGAWISWALLRDWTQAAYALLLTPAWLVSEWAEHYSRYSGADRIPAAAVLMLAIVYFLAPGTHRVSHTRRVMMWLGGLALLPATFLVCDANDYWYGTRQHLSSGAVVFGYFVAFAGPLVLASLLRKREAWTAGLMAMFVALLCSVPTHETRGFAAFAWRALGPYLVSGAASLVLIWLGVREERKERINLGVVGVALAILSFYFSNVMDKLGRSLSLIGLGILFLVVGWTVEKTRRRLLAGLGGAQ